MFLERYQLEDNIGQGGMGVVYKAYDTLLDRPVVLKLITDGKLQEAGRARLLAEAKAAGRLNHPNIVTIYDAGEENGQAFIVMEYVDGHQLDEKPLEMVDALGLYVQVCEGLAVAHQNGVVHRDLKPGNIKITPGGLVKLLDFGLARQVPAPRKTPPGQVVGTVHYLAPEVLMGEAHSPQSDLYALGVMLYEQTTGRPVFTEGSIQQELSQHLYATVTPPTTYNAKIPAELENLILQLLEKSPRQRPGSSMEVAKTLKEVSRKMCVRNDDSAPEIRQVTLALLGRGRIVGRDMELEKTRRQWQRTLEGGCGLLLVSGEPGIGKTRLMQEMVVHVRSHYGLAMVGRCYGDGDEPLAPFCQIIPDLMGYIPDPRKLSEMDLAELVRIVPELADDYPAKVQATALGDAERQSLTFKSVTRLIQLVAESAPVFLLFEDAQWAGEGTLKLIRHVARRVEERSLPVIIAITYRDDELYELPGLSELLIEFERLPNLLHLKLNRFTCEQTREMLQALFAEEITPEFLGGVYRETEGNPLFIEELCKELVDSGQLTRFDGRWHRPDMKDMKVPQNLRSAIEMRLQRMPPLAQDVLRMASVFGRTFDADLLKATGDWDEASLVDALELAEQYQWISEARELAATGGVQYRFSHAMVCSALQESFGAARAQVMHRKVLRVLQELRPNAFEQLAHHAREAGELATAATYYLRAGDRALRVYANEEAVQYLEKARELGLAAKEEGRAGYLIGSAYLRQGKFEQARSALERAALLLTEVEDYYGACDAYAELLETLFFYQNSRVCLERMRQISPLIWDWPNNAGMGRLCHQLARIYLHNDFSIEAAPFLERADQIARETGLLELELQVMSTHMLNLKFTKDETVFPKAAQLSKKAETCGFVGPGLARLYHNLAIGYRLSQQFDDAERCNKREIELIERLGMSTRRFLHDFEKAFGFIMAGKLEDACCLLKQMEKFMGEWENPLFKERYLLTRYFYQFALEGPVPVIEPLSIMFEKNLQTMNFIDVLFWVYTCVLIEEGDYETLYRESEIVFSTERRPGLAMMHVVACVCLNECLAKIVPRSPDWEQRLAKVEHHIRDLVEENQIPHIYLYARLVDGFGALVRGDGGKALEAFKSYISPMRMMTRDGQDFNLIFLLLSMARAVKDIAPEQAAEWYAEVLTFFRKSNSPYFVEKVGAELDAMYQLSQRS